MAITALQGKPCNTNRSLPSIDSDAPDFTLLDTKLKKKSLSDFTSNYKLLYVIPSLDTMVCANTTIKLNDLVSAISNVDVLVISADLPFAQQRFCKQNKLKNLKTYSMAMSGQNKFAEDYGVLLIDGALAGLAARAVFVLDKNNQIRYAELLPDITHEPNFETAINTFNS